MKQKSLSGWLRVITVGMALVGAVLYFDKGSIQNSVPPNRSGAVLQESRILFCGEEIMARSHCLQFAQSCIR